MVSDAGPFVITTTVSMSVVPFFTAGFLFGFGMAWAILLQLARWKTFTGADRRLID